MSASSLTGTPAVPTVSVRFTEGVADVPDGELTAMMLRHAGYEGDFISAESVNNVDPYAYTRESVEPQHVITELKYGSPVSRRIEGGKKSLPPELAKIVQDMAVSMAKEMLPTMLESALKSLVETHEETKGSTAPVAAKAKGKRGRKPGSGSKSSVQTPAPAVLSVSTEETSLLQEEVS